MPQNSEGWLLLIGAFFFLIGLLGGGFEIAAIKIPSIGKTPRIVAAALGLIILTIAVIRFISPGVPPIATQPTSASIAISINTPPSEPTNTSTSTDIQASSTLPNPTPTLMDAATSPPPITPAPKPLVYAPNIKDGDTVPQSLPLIGEYTPEVTDDIWVFVAPFGGSRYPQSPNACAGESAPKLNGRWEVPIGLGGPANVGERFEIIVTTANASASQSLAMTLQTWCQIQNFPGIPQNELPNGLTEHQHIVVRRGSEYSIPHQDISNSELPGTVILDSIGNSDTVPAAITVGGTYTDDVIDHIWVLVYPSDGKYYPQSTNACQGISTTQANGFWEARITVGGEGDDGKPVDIIVALVNEDVHAVFEARQEQGCQTSSYPGLLFIELPEGIDEKVSVSMVRQ